MTPKRLVIASLTVLASIVTPVWLTAQEAAGTDVEAEIATAPVELDNAVLFRVRGVSSFPAPERARRIHDRIAGVAGDRSIPVDSLHIVEGQNASRIVAGNQTLTTLTNADAALEQVQRSELAAVHLARLRQAIVEYREARSPASLRRDAVNTVIATIISAFAILALVRLWQMIDRLFARRLAARIRGVEIHSFEVMRAEQIASGLHRALFALGAIGLLAICLVYLQVVLAQWPWSRGASDNMTGLALAPLRVIGSSLASSVPSLIFLAMLFFLIRASLRLIHLFFDAVRRGTVKLTGFDPEWSQATYRIVRLAVVVFGLIVAYPYIPGSGSAAFKGISVFLGIVLSLGSSSAISNIIAGYMMIYRRAFKVGDRVKIGEATGEVIETRLQVTHLRSIKNEELVIPNSQILTSHVVNYSSLARSRGLILHTEVGIGYDTPWRQVEAMLLTAAERTTGLLREPPPFVLEKQLGKFAVIYELNAYCRDAQGIQHLYAELHRNALDVFNEQGVQIMTPAYEGDPLEPKIAPRKEPQVA